MSRCWNCAGTGIDQQDTDPMGGLMNSKCNYCGGAGSLLPVLSEAMTIAIPKDDEVRKQEAATKWAMEQITRNGAAGLDEAVLFGIAWRDKNPAPEVEELLEAIRGVIDLADDYAHPWFSEPLREALAEYQAARGK